MWAKVERDWKGGNGMTQKRREPAGSCDGKVSFANRADAVVIENRKSNDSRKQRMAYHCTVCRRWHLGTRVGKDIGVAVKREKRARIMELQAEDD